MTNKHGIQSSNRSQVKDMRIRLSVVETVETVFENNGFLKSYAVFSMSRKKYIICIAKLNITIIAYCIYFKKIKSNYSLKKGMFKYPFLP